MRAGSLFSGVGGLDLGLARAGFEHTFFCEADEWRRSVLAAHWPGVPIYEDVRDVGSGHLQPDSRRGESAASGHERDVRGRIACDLLAGGFPCQDLSVAGQRRGLAGDRSGLFFEFARIIDLVRPRWVLIENVPGLLSSNGGRDFGIVLETLADLGYGVAWRIFDSRFFGVPQRRRRVFIVGAVADDDSRAAAERAGQVLAVGTRCPGHPATRGEAREDVAGTLGGGAGESGWAQNTERMTFVANGLTHRYAKGTDSDATDTMVTHALTGEGHDASEDGNLISFDAEFSNQGEPHELASLTRTLRRAVQSEATGVRRLTPIECERLQAWPDGWTNPDGNAADSRRYAACGDGVTASVAEWIGQRIMEADA